ncbi:MAG: hypothetical protein II998_10150 [Clostridia bacterium]|nr:hypothetical protein [Clostridia bacterium]
MMRFKICLLLLMATLMSFSGFVYASENSVVLAPFDNFESYQDMLEAPWSAQGASSTVPIGQAGRGKSAKLVSVPGKMQEVFVNVPKTDSDKKSVITVFSLKLEDFNTKRTYFLRCDTDEFRVLDIATNGELMVSDKNIGIRLTTGVWYDLVVEYNMSTGFVRVRCHDGESEKVAQAQCSVKGISGIWRVNFVSWGTQGGDAVCYIDNCASYVAGYEVSPYAVAIKSYDFDDFVPSADGQKEPENWRLQNKSSGATTATVQYFDGYGNALNLTSNGTVHYQVIHDFADISGDTAIVEFDFRRTASSYVTFGLRGNNSSGELTRDRFPVSVLASGDVNAGDICVGTLAPDTWYHTVMNLNLDEQTYDISFIADDHTIYGSGLIPGDVRVLNGFDYYFQPQSGASSIYLDNVSAHSEVNVAFTRTSSVGRINCGQNTAEFEVEGDFTDVAVSNATITVNGDTENFISVTSDGNKIKVSYMADEYEQGYFVEICGLQCDDGTALSAATFNYTPAKYSISDFSFSSEVLSCGENGASLAVVSETDEYNKVTLILALYSKTTGEMLAITYDTKELTKGIAENLSCSLHIPDSDQTYELFAYIWDSIDGMEIIGETKILN